MPTRTARLPSPAALIGGISFAILPWMGPTPPARAADAPSAAPAAASPVSARAATPTPPPWDVNAPHGSTHSVDLELREGTWMTVTAHGDTIVFDLLGDLWHLPLAGGTATRLTTGPAWDSEPAFSPDGRHIAYVSDASGNDNIWIMEADGKSPHPLTREEVARVTAPAWDPAGPWIIGRKRTVDTRSIGVTELWQYHLEGGSGFQLTTLDTHPHAGEATVDPRYVWFSTRAGRFEYDQNPVAGLFRIARLDRHSKVIQTVVDGSGSAARPTLSPDGQQLAFISRDRARTLLEVLDRESGRRRVLADWLDHDQLEGFAVRGVYPAMTWLPDGSLLLWAGGRLWRVQQDGSRAEIPFVARGTWSFRGVARWPAALSDRVESRVIRWPVYAPDGTVAFSAMGALWLRSPSGAVERLSPGTGYAPAFSRDGRWLAWTSWSDKDGGRLHRTGLDRGRKTETLPIQGQLVNPSFSGDGQELVVVRGLGGLTSPDLGDELGYEVVLLRRQGKGWTRQVVVNVANRGSAARAPRPVLHGGRVWFMEDRAVEGRKPPEDVFVSVLPDGSDRRVHLVFPGAEEVAPSPDFTRVAYKSNHQARITALPEWGAEVKVEGDGLPVNTLTSVAGDWLSWTPDGREVTWAEGSTLVRAVVDGVGALPPPAPGETAPKGGTADPGAQGVTRTEAGAWLPRAFPSGKLALTHVRALTMEGPGETEVVEDATILLDGDRIESVVAGGAVPAGVRTIDCTGSSAVPGLIDVHAHLHYTAGDVLPEQEWRYLTALDFGVTTVSDPSASTDLVFTQAERVEAGLERGPRVQSTGGVLYGALDNQAADTATLEAALAHVRRMKRMGARLVKVYQQGQRQRRQWYVEACNQEQIQCVAEGGGDLWQDLSMVADGFHAIEHALPAAPLYDDVKRFFAASRGGAASGSLGTAYTPTLLVAYGGLEGEHWFYQHGNPLDDARLLRHFPRRELDRRVWRLPLMARDEDWNFQQVARDAADLARRGVLVTLGAHGQLQGLGVHWELRGLGGPGAMKPMEALRAATISGARYLGMDALVGSLKAGKLADLVVVKGDLREGLGRSTDLVLVVKNGVVEVP